MFGAIFIFISLVMGVIVLFAVVNTMTHERDGAHQRDRHDPRDGRAPRGVRMQFILEGAMIGRDRCDVRRRCWRSSSAAR